MSPADAALMEKAARAAGIEVRVERDPAYPFQEHYTVWISCGWVGQPSEREWNPIREDGDRLALARTLGMVLDYSELGSNEVRFWVGNEEAPRAIPFDPNVPNDEGRAVCLAAAAIGEQS